MLVKEVLAHAITYLKNHQIDSAAADARFIVAEVLKKNFTELFLHEKELVPKTLIDEIQEKLNERASGKPLAYILNRQSFWDVDLRVNGHTLIPRPETEILVETALKHLPLTPIQIADLGTGSGAIAITLAKARPQWHIIAIDLSFSALEIARLNALSYQLTNIIFTQGNWTDALPHNSMAAIIANPPYIDPDDPHLAQEVKTYEPKLALYAEDEGTSSLKTIIEQSTRILKDNGMLLLEHGFQQGAQVRNYLARSGYKNILTIKDLNQHERCAMAFFP